MVLSSMEDDRRGERETCGGDEVRTLVKANQNKLYLGRVNIISNAMQERLPTTTGWSAKLRPRQSLHLHLSGV